MEIVRTKDSGTLQHKIFFNEDESAAAVFECYRGANAALEHFANTRSLDETDYGDGYYYGQGFRDA